MHRYRIYVYYQTIVKEPYCIDLGYSTEREVFKFIFSFMRKWFDLIGTVICVKDAQTMIWEFRNSPNDGIYFRNLEAHYGKSYITKIHDV